MPSLACDNCGDTGGARVEAGVVATSADLWYCVECDETFCFGCVGCVHLAGTRRARHALEEVRLKATGRLGIHFYDPLLVLLLCLGLLFLCAFGRESYARTIHCPVISYLKSAVMRDPVIYYQTKAYWATTCDAEDSVLRYFTDAWVRGVVTGTDSWYLLLLQLQAAMVGTVVVLLLLPILCSLAAVVFTVAYALEVKVVLPRAESVGRGGFAATTRSRAGRGRAPNQRRMQQFEANIAKPFGTIVSAPARALVAVAYATPIAGLLKGMHLAGGRGRGDCAASGNCRRPPVVTNAPLPTFLRRCVRYFYHRSAVVCEEFLVTASTSVFVFRFAILLFGGADALRGVLHYLGLGGPLARHEAQHADVPHGEASSYLLETLVRSVLGDDVSLPLVAAGAMVVYVCAASILGW